MRESVTKHNLSRNTGACYIYWKKDGILKNFGLFEFCKGNVDFPAEISNKLK